VTVFASVVFLLGSYVAAMPAPLPYETASPHQPFRQVLQTFKSLSQTILPAVECRGEGECTGFEKNNTNYCGVGDQCTASECKETGAEKSCTFEIAHDPICDGCMFARNLGCEPPI
jgi:hypothetical protein